MDDAMARAGTSASAELGQERTCSGIASRGWTPGRTRGGVERRGDRVVRRKGAQQHGNVPAHRAKSHGGMQPVSRPSRKFGDGIVSGRRISPLSSRVNREKGRMGRRPLQRRLPQVSTRRASPLEMERERRRERERAERDEKGGGRLRRRRLGWSGSWLSSRRGKRPSTTWTSRRMTRGTMTWMRTRLPRRRTRFPMTCRRRGRTPEPDEDEDEDAHHRTPSAAGYHPRHHAPATDPYHHQQVYRAAAGNTTPRSGRGTASRLT